MGFKLFKRTKHGYVATSFDNLEDKAFWCDHGEKQENAFVEVMKKIVTPYTIEIHPSKLNDPYHPDLLVTEVETQKTNIGEVKIKNSPLFYGEKYGVSPQYALTMDLKDSFNYLKWLQGGIDISIFLWVKWEAHKMEARGKVYEVVPMAGIWMTKFSKLRKLEEISPPPIHWYNSSFRKPQIYHAHQEKKWCNELALFDKRLLSEDGKTTNITSKGFMKVESGETFPTGHSSGSYVFNLKDKTVFDELFFWIAT